MEKKLHQDVDAMQQAHPDADVEVGAQDEQRLGLKPFLRRA
ncbi:MAG: hypothetical protein AAFR26_26875 [Cyanobacteria bacterium J06626_4]